MDMCWQWLTPLCLGCTATVPRACNKREKYFLAACYISVEAVMTKLLSVRRQEVDLDGLISHGHSHTEKAGYMRRKCFYANKKLVKGLEMAESNASYALAVFTYTPEPSRKQCCSSASAFPAPIFLSQQ